jgi:hypothetical protein
MRQSTWALHGVMYTTVRKGMRELDSEFTRDMDHDGIATNESTTVHVSV